MVFAQNYTRGLQITPYQWFIHAGMVVSHGDDGYFFGTILQNLNEPVAVVDPYCVEICKQAMS